ncbi:MAG: transglycosylase SLT domain-containing protein [Clostridiales Family XIII bacterium]|nr:transglycosylase SLT domain-containing protein [Clostridiales Family XIII bacterium]
MGSYRKMAAMSLTVAVLILSAISAYAGDHVRGSFFLKDIVINGEEITNYNLQYPLFMYNDTTYIPLTADMKEICGIKAEMDWENDRLILQKAEPTISDIREDWTKNNAEDVEAFAEGGISIGISVEPEEEGPKPHPALEALMALAFDRKAPPEPTPVDLGESPVIVKDRVVYVPARALAGAEALGWDVHYDPYLGICISTLEGVSAQSVFPQGQADYNRGLADYIRSKNSGIGASRAQELVFLFQRAAEVNGLDEKLLIAVTQAESRFRTDAVSRSGATGLMQMMPGTAAGFGIDSSGLLDAKTSIDTGAAYLGNQMRAFDGNLGLALSAYNQGSRNVSRGNFSRGYAEKVSGIVGDIDAYLQGSQEQD